MAKAAAMWNDYKVEQGMPETKKRPAKTDEEKAEAKQRKAEKKAAAEDGDNVSVASSKASSKGKADGPKVKRPPTAYNIFVREKIAELKAAQPGLEPKQMMAMAAAAYQKSKATAV